MARWCQRGKEFWERALVLISRTNSLTQTHALFLEWHCLAEYLRKGFVMDEERLKKPNMGLASWRGGAVRKGDVTVAKNLLLESEVGELNRIVVMFLDFAEDQARRRRQAPVTHTARMKAAIDTPGGRARYAQRVGAVEPVFANVRYNKGLDRFTLRGRAKVDGQWKLFCLVHNIEKLATHGYAA